ncbi:hypothetical protein FQN54_004442 [Arachnomyces sp. PD_36]|nr:hypothetical protein FQN54_004442 [Arachnomyces sp. PD_36]
MAPSLEEHFVPAEPQNGNIQKAHVLKTWQVGEYNDEEHAGTTEDLIIGENGYKYRMLDGRAMPPFVTPQRYELSRTLRLRDTDICYTSYPKSGSTWLSYILVLLTNNKGSSLRDSYHWVECSWLYPRSEEYLETAPNPRIFASHMPIDMAVGGDVAKSRSKYVYIARNPKDVVVSYFHFESRKSWAGNYTGDWDHWFKMFVQGKLQRGDWFDHVLGWWNNRHLPNVHFMTYEGLKRDTDGELRKLAEFIGVELTDEKLEEVKSQSDFGTMKKSEFSGLGDVKELGEAFFRKGKVGSWKEQFTVQQNELFDQLWAERVGDSGLTFDFN